MDLFSRLCKEGYMCTIALGLTLGWNMGVGLLDIRGWRGTEERPYGVPRILLCGRQRISLVRDEEEPRGNEDDRSKVDILEGRLALVDRYE